MKTFAGKLSQCRNSNIFINDVEDINTINYDSLLWFTVCGSIIGLINLVLRIIFEQPQDVYFAILPFSYALILLFFRKRQIIKEEHGTRALYFAQIPLIIYAIYTSFISDPASPAFMSILVLMTFPLFIFDKPANIARYIVLSSIIFIIFAYNICPPASLEINILHILLLTPTILTISMFTTYMRILNFELTLKLEHESVHDPLTGIYNRRGGIDSITGLLQPKKSGCFIIVDIDNFKHINDTYSHLAGDKVLKQTAEILRKNFRSTDIIMRLGGDEFIVYAPFIHDEEIVKLKLEGINKCMAKDKTMIKFNTTVSMGCILHKGHLVDYEKLYEEADKLLYESKDHGKNSYSIKTIH